MKELYKVVKINPVNIYIFVGLSSLCLILAFIIGLLIAENSSMADRYNEEADFRAVLLDRLDKANEQVDFLQNKTDVMQTSYNNLLLAGFAKVGAEGMNTIVNTANKEYKGVGGPATKTIPKSNKVVQEE